MSIGFGLIPDLLRGKKFEDALATNAKQGAMAGLAFFGAPAMFGSAAAPTAAAPTNAALIDSSLGTAGYGVSSATPASGSLGLGGALKAASSYAQPAMQSLQAAQAAKGLLSEPQAQPVQTYQGNPGGAQVLAQLAQQTPQEQKRQRVNWG